MISSKRNSMLLVVLIALVLLDIGIRVRQRSCSNGANPLAGLFGVVNVHTNGSDGIVIIEKKTGRPLWGKWSFGSTNESDSVSYFFEGRNIMNVYPQTNNNLPRLDVTFFGTDGTVLSVWANRGTNEGFTTRDQYGKDGPRRQVWFNESWRTLEYRTNDGRTQAGIVVGGKWEHVLVTNGAVGIEP